MFTEDETGKNTFFEKWDISKLNAINPFDFNLFTAIDGNFDATA